MGCFLVCFGDGKRRKSKNKSFSRDRSQKGFQSPQPSFPLKEAAVESAVHPLLEVREKADDLSFNSRKKVTFDLIVKTYEDVSVHEFPNYSSGNEEEKENGKEDSKEERESQPLTISEDKSTVSSQQSFPLNHRYQNCVCSDDEIGEEEEDMEYEDSDFDDDDDDNDSDDEREEGEEESFESCFSLPMEKEQLIAKSRLEKKEDCYTSPIFESIPDKKSTISVNENARDRSQYVHPVLNPVENLSQWKAAKARLPPSKQQKKQNIDLEQELNIPFSSEPTFKLPKPRKPLDSNQQSSVLEKPSPKQEISVDTSLSNWLVSYESTPLSKTSIAQNESSENSRSSRSYSSKIHDDRPILGALTIDELKQHSVSSSPRRSPSRSPDEVPIVGSVGSYWNSSSSPRSRSGDVKGIPNTTSKYREDKRVNWHNTPFEVRLERALIEGAAEAYSSYQPKVC